MPVNGQIHVLTWVKYTTAPSAPEAMWTRTLTGRCEQKNLLLLLKITLIYLSFCLVTISTDLFQRLGSSRNAVNKEAHRNT